MILIAIPPLIGYKAHEIRMQETGDRSQNTGETMNNQPPATNKIRVYQNVGRGTDYGQLRHLTEMLLN
jgi:hypothetical protein